MTFEVKLSTGDSAEADDIESALLAARTMAADALGTGRACVVASFYLDGERVLGPVEVTPTPKVV